MLCAGASEIMSPVVGKVTKRRKCLLTGCSGYTLANLRECQIFVVVVFLLLHLVVC